MALIHGTSDWKELCGLSPVFKFNVSEHLKKVNWALRKTQSEITDMVELTEALIAHDEHKAITTRQFAFLAGLEPKTVNNYILQGKILAKKDSKKGCYMIPKSQLEKIKPND